MHVFRYESCPDLSYPDMYSSIILQNTRPLILQYNQIYTEDNPLYSVMKLPKLNFGVFS